MEFDTKSDDFQNSPLALVYYAVANELRERDPVKKKRPFHHRVALWAAWESHRVAPGTEATAGEFFSMLGLPRTQRGMADLLGVSPRTLRQYSMDYSEFVATAREMGVQRVLAQYDLAALHALGQVASLPEPSAVPGMRLFLHMRGLLPAEKADANVAVNSGGMTVEEWKAERARRLAEVEKTESLYNDGQ